MRGWYQEGSANASEAVPPGGISARMDALAPDEDGRSARTANVPDKVRAISKPGGTSTSAAVMFAGRTAAHCRAIPLLVRLPDAATVYSKMPPIALAGYRIASSYVTTAPMPGAFVRATTVLVVE